MRCIVRSVAGIYMNISDVNHCLLDDICDTSARCEAACVGCIRLDTGCLREGCYYAMVSCVCKRITIHKLLHVLCSMLESME